MYKGEREKRKENYNLYSPGYKPHKVKISEKIQPSYKIFTDGLLN